ncbi:alkaline ceramidase 3 [Brachionus plicatilis]|uniref:Alkaline ceramidase n=1 Tax=Brachionus plicatilis TaxID=10195 RepID=A0A3M7R2M7_BRAPC|nr:alkaline ceramidase 3 [Brachionus plicatilis]
MHGYWGNRTATIDWCENNYEVTHYVAEFWNTLSNFVLILFPLYGVYWSLKHIHFSKKHSTSDRKYFKIPTSLILCHVGLTMVGIGSWMFHMTLLYPMQLLDELPMIYGTGILIYANYEIIMSVYQLRLGQTASKPGPLAKVLSSKSLIISLIILYCSVVTFVYMSVWKNPIFHEVAFAIMSAVVICENVSLIRMLNMSKRLYAISFGYYMFGFLLWNIDNKFCSYLKTYRQGLEDFFGIDKTSIQASSLKAIGLNGIVVSLKSISEFHSLWHIFTGYGSYMCLLFLTEVHYQYYLIRTKAASSKEKIRPVGSKFFNMYYQLNDSLIVNEKESFKLKKCE